MKFDLNDILIVPEKISTIKSRYENINPMVSPLSNVSNNIPYYPIMTAPMTSVVNMNNVKTFRDNKIPVVYPRFNYKSSNNISKFFENLFSTVTFDTFTFFSFSLNDFKKYYCSNTNFFLPNLVLIDTANGHLNDILEAVEIAKNNRNNLIIMVGNIANPETYRWYAESGLVDYVRIGIGNGNGCLTTEHLGIGYPMGSLIRECYEIKNELLSNSIKPPYIVADGGMKKYADIIKALALGADFVMIGSIFNKALESAGDNFLYGIKINESLANLLYPNFPIKKKFYGMSTKIAQKELGNNLKKLKTSEGVLRYRNVEYKLSEWIENFDHYLRSAMSYSNASNLHQFIGNVKFEIISQHAYKRFNK